MTSVKQLVVSESEAPDYKTYVLMIGYLPPPHKVCRDSVLLT